MAETSNTLQTTLLSLVEDIGSTIAVVYAMDDENNCLIRLTGYGHGRWTKAPDTINYNDSIRFPLQEYRKGFAVNGIPHDDHSTHIFSKKLPFENFCCIPCKDKEDHIVGILIHSGKPGAGAYSPEDLALSWPVAQRIGKFFSSSGEDSSTPNAMTSPVAQKKKETISFGHLVPEYQIAIWWTEARLNVLFQNLSPIIAPVNLEALAFSIPFSGFSAKVFISPLIPKPEDMDYALGEVGGEEFHILGNPPLPTTGLDNSDSMQWHSLSSGQCIAKADLHHAEAIWQLIRHSVFRDFLIFNEWMRPFLKSENNHHLQRTAKMIPIIKTGISRLSLGAQDVMDLTLLTVISSYFEPRLFLINGPKSHQMLRNGIERFQSLQRFCPSTYAILTQWLERYDGTGHPSGLRGGQCSILVRLCHIAYAYAAQQCNQLQKTPSLKSGLDPDLLSLLGLVF